LLSSFVSGGESELPDRLKQIYHTESPLCNRIRLFRPLLDALSLSAGFARVIRIRV
jgi:hypothetical protein